MWNGRVDLRSMIASTFRVVKKAVDVEQELMFFSSDCGEVIG